MTGKEQPSVPQPEQTQNSNIHVEDEISLIDVLEVLLRNKFLILAMACISTLITLYISKSIKPIYQATIGILEPQETYLLAFPEKIVLKLQGVESETPTPSPYSQFLSKITSFSHKKEVFEQGDFLQKFYGINNVDLIDNAVLEIHNSFTISKEKIDEDLPLYIRPIYLKLSGSNPRVMSEYLTALVKSAKAKTIVDVRNVSHATINAEINNISSAIEKMHLSTKEKMNKEFMVLSEALKIAERLGIQKNNFQKLNNQDFQVGIQQQTLLQSILNDNIQSNSNIRIVNNSFPLWFLYGKNALVQELDKHQVRKSEEVIIGLAKIQSVLKQYQAIDLSSLDIKVAIISDPSIPPTIPINSKDDLFVLTGMFTGLFIGIIIAFIRNLMSHLKQRQLSTTSTDKP
jgi:LPS O-antigen subunit length determinant protein (WzzB/FepE family)